MHRFFVLSGEVGIRPGSLKSRGKERYQGEGERGAPEMGPGGRSPSGMRVLGKIGIGLRELEMEREREISGGGVSPYLVDSPLPCS